MDIKDFIAGKYKDGYKYKYFLPEKINHTFVWTDSAVNSLLEKASLKLGELNSFSKFVPDTDLFIMMHIYKEAILSSRIEGTRTNIEEALVEETEIDPEKRDDRKEVIQYVEAMNRAIDELKTLPLSNRLIKNTHKILLSSGRGQNKTPGEFRKSQNWIGGASLADARFIPPSQDELSDLLSDFEKFLHNDEINIPHLVRIAIAHYQFETIHPFLDGNGRIGRLLITLYLVANNILDEPLLYLSDFFEKNRELYYDNLTLVRTKNDLTHWIKFFLTGIIQTADNSLETLNKITKLKSELENRIIMQMGKRTKTANVLLQGLFKKPFVNIRDVQKITGLAHKAAYNLVNQFTDKGILTESTGYQRNRVFMFDDYIKMFK